MSFLKRQWIFHKSDETAIKEISKSFSLSAPISQVLLNRGLKTPKDIEFFLNPKLSFLRDPFEIPDMEKAVDKTLTFVKDKKDIFVWGDYDTDGVTGTSIIMLCLKKLGANAKYYIPHRYNEGYGLNKVGIEKIAKSGGQLLITVDCGISNFDEIEYAKSIGIDVIVTDHHNLPEKLPNAFACVNPKIIKGDHPSKDLSGAGVAFKFVWALLRRAGEKNSSVIKDFLDLAALGTIADVVPLTGENRILAVSGIKLLNQKKRHGVKCLVEAAKFDGEINSKEISFILAPRLNAPGRLRHAELSLKLLLENDPQKAKLIADEINIINTQRQQIGSLIGEDVFSRIKDVDRAKLIVLSGKNWHPGVIGIVASKISEKFNRPSILISDNGKTCRGSARSIDGFDIYNLLKTCHDIFLDFGGHKDAAGFEISSDLLEEFKNRISQKIDVYCSFEELIPKTKIDAEAKLDDITLDFAMQVNRLSPFGQGNLNPVFMTPSLKISSISKIGANGNHLKIQLFDGASNSSAVGFGFGELFGKIKKGMKVDIAYNVFLGKWNGDIFPKIRLVDIRRAEQ